MFDGVVGRLPVDQDVGGGLTGRNVNEEIERESLHFWLSFLESTFPIVSPPAHKLFEEDAKTEARYELGVELHGLILSSRKTRFSERLKYDARFLISADVDAEWKIFDRLQRRIVFTARVRASGREKGSWRRAVGEGLRASADQLVGSSTYVEFVQGAEGALPSDPRPTVAATSAPRPRFQASSPHSFRVDFGQGLIFGARAHDDWNRGHDSAYLFTLSVGERWNDYLGSLDLHAGQFTGGRHAGEDAELEEFDQPKHYDRSLVLLGTSIGRRFGKAFEARAGLDVASLTYHREPEDRWRREVGLGVRASVSLTTPEELASPSWACIGPRLAVDAVVGHVRVSGRSAFFAGVQLRAGFHSR